MGFMVRNVEATCKFSEAVTIEALEQAITHTDIEQALEAENVVNRRTRKLTLIVTVWVIIALHLFSWLAVRAVFRKISRGLRFVWANPSITLPGDSALAYRRQQVGVRPMVTLFKRVCQPIATPETEGAFLFGLRSMALDGTTEEVPDTPANAAAFGRHTNDQYASAFPQVQGVYLVECGTHAVIDAGFWPCLTSERKGGFRLLRSVTKGMLLMWDCGFHSFDMVVETRKRGAHVLGRLSAGVKPYPIRPLSDGSILAELRPGDQARQRAGEYTLVRVIPYTITDPNMPGHGETYRVITTILNPRVAPAHEVACAYHERWEIELVIDEIDTHQRLVGRTLRSLTPTGCLQEFYGILLAHYAVRVLMHEAALAAEIDPDRLSFVHAVEVLRDAVAEFQMVAPEQQAALYERLLDDIASKRLPPRRPRSNPRVVKRKGSKFSRKRTEHAAPASLAGDFCDAIQVLPPPTLELSSPHHVVEGSILAVLQQYEETLI